MSASPGVCVYTTVMSAARSLFDGGLTPEERVRTAGWILAHRNRRRGFVFYPSPADRQAGLRLLTGEKPRTRLLADNALELETLRLLATIEPESPEVQEVLEEANRRLLKLCFADVCTTGECAAASIAFLRYLAAYDPGEALRRAERMKRELQSARDGKGGWRGFPFWFTLLWLSELPLSIIHDELAYVRAHSGLLCRKKPPAADCFSAVRRAVLLKARAKLEQPRFAHSPTDG